MSNDRYIDLAVEGVDLLVEVQEFLKNGTPVYPGSLLADEIEDYVKKWEERKARM